MPQLYDENGKPITEAPYIIYGYTCKHCLNSGFAWGKTKRGAWVLYNVQDGKFVVHRCKEKKQ
jgi:hypothetical protein